MRLRSRTSPLQSPSPTLKARKSDACGSARSCGTPGCTLPDYHLGPHLCDVNGAKRRRSSVCVERPSGGEDASKRSDGSDRSEFDSTSKKAQRFRISEELAATAAAGVKPRLFLVGAPDVRDAAHFKRLAPREARFVSLNRGPMESTSLSGVELVPHTEAITYLAEAPAGTFTHVWLDLTERSVDMELLFCARRVLDDLEREQLYVSLSTSRTTPQHCEDVFSTQLHALGGRVTHTEYYRGCNGTGAESQRRNMVFFAVHFKRAGCMSTGLYNHALNAIGGMAWVALDEAVPAGVSGITFACKGTPVHTYVCVVERYVNGKYVVRPLSANPGASAAPRVVEAARLHKIGEWNQAQVKRLQSLQVTRAVP